MSKELRKSVVVKVRGGLGNQLFCYAMARAFSIKHNRKCVLDAYTDFRLDRYERSFRLNHLPLSSDVQISKSPIRYSRIHQSIDKFLPLKYRVYIKEKYTSRDRMENTQFSPNEICLDGFWQSEKYFSDLRDTLRKELAFQGKLSPEDQKTIERIRQTQSVFLHVRRIQYHSRLSTDYYQAALETIRKKIANPTFFVFGDDLNWIRESGFLEGTDHQFVEHNDQFNELYDMELMKHCDHAIVANSSFSWWGAWLIQNPDRLVVAPDHAGFPLEMASDWHKVKVNYAA